MAILLESKVSRVHGPREHAAPLLLVGNGVGEERRIRGGIMVGHDNRCAGTACGRPFTEATVCLELSGYQRDLDDTDRVGSERRERPIVVGDKIRLVKGPARGRTLVVNEDRKSTRLNSSHQ